MEIVNVTYAGQGIIEQNYSIKDENLIDVNYINSTFGDPEDRVELFIYDVNSNLIDAVYDFKQYTPYQTINSQTNKFNRILIDPVKDAKERGFNRGEFNVQYNFLKNLFNSSDFTRYWIKDISPSRTELRLSSQTIGRDAIINGYNQYLAYKSLKNYYSDFYLNFGNNELLIAINVSIETSGDDAYLLIKLYEPLPFDYEVKSQLWIVDKLSDSVSYDVNIEIESNSTENINYLRGPNFSVRINQKNTQTTPYYNYSNLIASPITSSFRQLASYYQDSAISINVDYTNFENFIHFSSATERINNFVYKLGMIERYSEQITSQSAVLGSSNNAIVTSSITNLQTSISNIIENFDIYEYYLYYSSESFAWPKYNSTKPYQNVSVSSSIAKNWLGSSTTYPSQYTASLLYSASLYDDTNKDILRATIPQYILDDSDNAPYVTFMDMMGQHFDNIWVYYKDVSNRYNATNDPYTGISLDSVSDALRGMGFQLYTNTNVSNNVYYDLFGYNEDGSLLPPTGSEKISTYVTSSLPTGSIGSKQSQQEIYKRLYHNLPYLYKTKGTQRGIKALLSIYGIPESILTVNEFGGYNKYDKTGLDAINNDKIQVVTSSLQISSSVLSPYVTLQYYDTDRRLNSTNVEVGFSIADVIDKNISSSLGYIDIDQLIGSPADQYLNYYPSLVSASNSYFSSYTYPHSVWEYIRLIKYFNNSIFKTIKDFVPARANLSTGIIVKSHVLERNKYARHEPEASFNDYSQSIDMVEIYGEPGNIISGSTNWSKNIITIAGEVPYSSSQNVEKLTGEFDGSYIVVTDGKALDQSENSNNASGSLITVNYGALYQNVSMSVRSQRFFDLDYNFNQLIPVNLNLITQSINNSINNNYSTYTNPDNPYAYVQDTNYYLRSFTDPRFYGSRTQSAKYNVYTIGDSSFGKTAAIDKIKQQYAYLVDIYSASVFFPGRSNAQIKYLIDNNQNVLDLTKANLNIFDVQNVFKSSETTIISLFKYDEANSYTQQLANNSTLQIYEGGYRYLPILHNINSSNRLSQSFDLTSPIEITQIIAGGSQPLTASSPYLDPNNYVAYVESYETQNISNPTYSDYYFYVSASYIGPTPPVQADISLTVSTRFDPEGGCFGVLQQRTVNISNGQVNGRSTIPLDNPFLDKIATGNARPGYSRGGGLYWPPFPPYSISECNVSVDSVSATTSGGGGEPITVTYYTSTFLAGPPCIYYLSASNELVLNGAISYYYSLNDIREFVFNSTSDPGWVGSGLDRAILPFNLSVGDRISIFDAQSGLGWSEKSEYTIVSTRFTGSVNTLSSSRLLISVDGAINTNLLSTTGSQDFITRSNLVTCKYVIWKHVPDETNVILRYNPKDSNLVEEGLLFPQYISEEAKLNSGNTIKALRAQNLLPPQP